MNPPDESKPWKRRVRYKGTHPRRFSEKYKEHDPVRYAPDIAKVIARGHTPAGMHRPICVEEILSILHPTPGEVGLDATLGYGGHSLEILKRISPGGRLYATDVDTQEMPRTTERLRKTGFGEEVFIPRQINFAGIHRILPELPGNGFDFILADLGISSMQLDDPQRGFSFKHEGPLDLRLNPSRGRTAAELLRTLTENDLERILRTHGDEPEAAAIAKSICEARGDIHTTLHLADAIRRALPPMTVVDKDLLTQSVQRCFQALRIELNEEMGALGQFLRALPFAMKPGGRVAILTFHSGEDRRVCQAFREGVAAGVYSGTNEEAVRPGAKERYDNPRSRSARLRWAVRG